MILIEYAILKCLPQSFSVGFCSCKTSPFKKSPGYGISGVTLSSPTGGNVGGGRDSTLKKFIFDHNESDFDEEKELQNLTQESRHHLDGLILQAHNVCFRIRSSPSANLEQPSRFGMCESGDMINEIFCFGSSYPILEQLPHFANV